MRRCAASATGSVKSGERRLREPRHRPNDFRQENGPKGVLPERLTIFFQSLLSVLAIVQLYITIQCVHLENIDSIHEGGGQSEF